MFLEIGARFWKSRPGFEPHILFKWVYYISYLGLYGPPDAKFKILLYSHFGRTPINYEQMLIFIRK